MASIVAWILIYYFTWHWKLRSLGIPTRERKVVSFKDDLAARESSESSQIESIASRKLNGEFYESESWKREYRSSFIPNLKNLILDSKNGPAIIFTFGDLYFIEPLCFVNPWRPPKIYFVKLSLDVMLEEWFEPSRRWSGEDIGTSLYLSQHPEFSSNLKSCLRWWAFLQKVGSGEGKSSPWFLKMWWVERRPCFRCFLSTQNDLENRFFTHGASKKLK